MPILYNLLLILSTTIIENLSKIQTSYDNFGQSNLVIKKVNKRGVKTLKAKNNKDNNFFIPERLFISNLSKCLNYSYESLLEEINNRVSGNIREELKDLKGIVNNMSDIEDLQLFTNSFVSFVNDKEFLKCKKQPEYCMFKCYEKVSNALNNPILKYEIKASSKKMKTKKIKINLNYLMI